MSSAAEHYDEAIERSNLRFNFSYIVPTERNAIIREECIAAIEAAVAEERDRNSIPMILFCPSCGLQHVDAPDGDWTNPPHKSHLCAGCGHIWRPSSWPTNGVADIDSRGKADSAIIRDLVTAVAKERARCIAVARENTHWFKVELESDCLVCESAQRIISAIERGDEPSDDPT